MQKMDIMIPTARLVSRLAHGDQKDKGGAPFYLHPANVASQLNTPLEKVVGYLHDVLEDTDVTEQELYSVFGEQVTEYVKMMTHDDAVPYMEYIRKLAENPVTRHVKMADLRHNMDESRFLDKEIPEHLKWKKRECYIPAYEYLMEKETMAKISPEEIM